MKLSEGQIALIESAATIIIMLVALGLLLRNS